MTRAGYWHSSIIPLSDRSNRDNDGLEDLGSGCIGFWTGFGFRLCKKTENERPVLADGRTYELCTPFVPENHDRPRTDDRRVLNDMRWHDALPGLRAPQDAL